MLAFLFPKSYRRYVESPFGVLHGSFGEWLVNSGYSRNSARDHVRRLCQALEGMPPVGVDHVFSHRELSEMFGSAVTKPYRAWLLRATQRAFTRFLDEREQLFVEPDQRRFGQLLDSYREFLVEARGLATKTIEQHMPTVTAFLESAVPASARLEALSPEAVESFVVAASQRVTRHTLQHIVAHLRAFLRFCFDHGLISEQLDRIDTPRTYRDELPPRALPWPLVQGLLSSIDQSSKGGWRDHAMLYLMAYFGLRPSEIVSLTIDAINWQAKTLSVAQRKTRSLLMLPLTEEALRVLEDYLRNGRTPSVHRELFLSCRSPFRPIKHYAVCDVYGKRARESGLPLQGTSSYALRHAFAMRLLDQGIAVKTIGDLLGHRTLEATCVYLRLQTEALRSVGLPVPSEPETSGQARND